jgi:hypothetical protein
MDYERGLEQLKQLLRGTAWEQEFQLYEFRLRENLRKERLYGANPQNTADRGPIIYELNRLAGQVDTSFNDLCLAGNILSLQTPPQPNYGFGTGTGAQGQPASGQSAVSQRNKLYISFHSSDKSYLNELHAQLDPLVHKRIIDYWDQTKIKPGDNWRVEIDRALQSTRVAILLVSTDFLAAEATDPIISRELPALLSAARKQEVTIVNVIVRSCILEYSDLELFQPFNPQPLGELKRSEREKIWGQVVRYVRGLLR